MEETIFNLAEVTVSCMCAASLILAASRQLDCLAYRESITDTYNQNFVNRNY